MAANQSITVNVGALSNAIAVAIQQATTNSDARGSRLELGATGTAAAPPLALPRASESVFWTCGSNPLMCTRDVGFLLLSYHYHVKTNKIIRVLQPYSNYLFTEPGVDTHTKLPWQTHYVYCFNFEPIHLIRVLQPPLMLHAMGSLQLQI